jgi:hypothetical protein
VTLGMELIELVQEISKQDAGGNYTGTWTLLNADDVGLSFIEDGTFRLKVFKLEKVHDRALPPKGKSDAEA